MSCAQALMLMALFAAKVYVDAQGKKRSTMKHEMLLPHELVASFYKRADLFQLLTGAPGATRSA